MKQKLFKSVFLIVAFAAIFTLPLSAMTPEMKKQVAEWIDTYVLAQDVNPDDYWESIKKLGARIDKGTAEALANLDSYTREEAVALMAFEVAWNPERAKELTAWYGRYEYQIENETREKLMNKLKEQGLPRRDYLQPMIYKSPGGPQGRNPHQVRPIDKANHQTEEYRTAWQAWLLSPRGEERHKMFGRIRAALLNLPHASNIPIAILATKQLPMIDYPNRSQEELNQVRLGEALVHANFVLQTETVESVLAVVEMNRIAIEQSYADVAPDRISRGPHSNFTPTMERAFAARNFYSIDEIFEDREKWSNVDERRYVTGDHWKTFKPIIEELLANPEANNLTDIDIALLEEALRIMPDAPFPGKDQ